MQSTRTLRALGALLFLLVAFVPAVQAQIQNTTTLLTYPTIADAVVAANPGETISIANGNYVINSTLNINKGITLAGQSEAGVILQINTGASYGIKLAADDITLRDLTLEIISTTGEGGYPIHAQGTDEINGVGFSNLLIEHLTVFGDATTGDVNNPQKRRAGVDIHGFNNVVLDDIDSRDASYGNGIQITGCIDVTVTNCSTSNNKWGSVAVYVSGATYMNRGSANVEIDGNTLSAGEGVVFQEDEPLIVSTNVTVLGYEYNVFNPVFRPEAPLFKFFLDTLADATTSALAFGPFAYASTIQRIDDGHFVVPAGLTIQAAVDAASAGGTVEVLAGNFEERVEIGMDLTLMGAGAGVTTIESPALVPLAYDNNKPIVYVHDAAAVQISDLTVDGLDRGNANYRFYGITYRNAGGSISDCDVVNVRDLPNPNISGTQHGNGIYLYNNDTVTRSITVQGCNVSNFQKNGITLLARDGTALTATVDGNVVTGAGVLGVGEPAQNGVQIEGELVTGTVSNNTVSGIAYDNTNSATKWVAVSFLDFYSSVDFVGNLVPDSQVGVYKIDGSGSISGNDITVNKIGVASWGVIGTDPPNAVPQPFAEAEVAPKSVLAKAVLLNVVMDGNVVTFSGVDNTSTFGLEVDAGYGPNDIAATITNNVVSGFEAAVDVFQCPSGCSTGVFTSVSVNQNDLTDNTYGVRSNVGYLTVDASCNWYGDTSGPLSALENPAGTGSAVEGDVVFEPWLDAPGGACVLSTDFASVGPAPGEIGSCTPCIDVPVSITRLDASTARGVSVTFELSPELELCGFPTLSVGAGTFYDGFGPVQPYFVANPDGSYTFDTAILGGACGPTGGGEVFTIPVTNAASVVTDVTGQITITAVTFRDCANLPLPLFPGAPTEVDIDVTAPGAVTSLVASQVRTGNDSSGRTKIDLTWTLPADLDLTAVKLYRKGFGSYPEYDDLGGSVPTAPADIATALGAGWALAATLPAGTTSYTDQPPVRDFWYYVAFTADECDDSPVSNITGGTLNYHLGDVAPPPNGNNLVFTGDISVLGTAYGTVDGDALYNNVVDVGPTTDFSVIARPTTDNRIQFEDLIVFAINYNQVGKLPVMAVASVNALELMEPGAWPVGEMVSVPVRMAGDGTVQGVSVQVVWNNDVLEYAGWNAGDLMARQAGTAPVFSPETGVIDAAVLGTGRQGIAGDGVLARLQFRVKREGAAGLRFEQIEARDGANERVSLDGSVVSGAPSAPVSIAKSLLRSNVPNPFNPSTKVLFATARAGQVTLRIYDVSGRLVRTLVQGEHAAGEHEVVWNGTDDAGRGVASGTYLLRMTAPDASDSHRLLLLK